MDSLFAQLRANDKYLIEQYYANVDAVFALQAMFIDEVLPDLQDELNLDANSMQWAKEWLQDTTCLFHILRRHNFTRSTAMESIRRNLVWRLNSMDSQFKHLALNFQILADPDPFGRPIILLKISDLSGLHGQLKDMFIPTMERHRLHLKQINDKRLSFGEAQPVLQYVVLLDATGLYIRNLRVDLITWTLHEVIPRFPGMFAALFIVNYSWTHSGIWNVMRRLLPSTALSRIIFSSRDDLIPYFGASLIPDEYTGTLHSTKCIDSQPCFTAQDPTAPHVCRLPKAMSSMSLLNPFFGYPVSVSMSSHSLRHGRRRKRDLLRTLARLWWMRWKKHVNVVMWVVAFGVSMWLWWRRLTWTSVNGRRLLWRKLVESFI